MNSTQLEKLNAIFGRELGRTQQGHPNYAWVWSEDARMKHGMRVPDTYTWVTDPKTGLLAAGPVYETRKLCMTATSQWVLCHWIESPSEEEWIELFGYRLEWPRCGQYWPTNVQLDPGEIPDASFTLEVAKIVKQELSKKAAQLEQEFLARKTREENAQKSRIYDEIRDMIPTYDHIPGVRDMVSYPSVLDRKVQSEMALSKSLIVTP